MADENNELFTGVVLQSHSLYAETPPISFSTPILNSAMIISPDLFSDVAGKYYGDEITIRFWAMLKLPYGKSNNPENPLTRVDDYLYVYHHRNRTFDAYDNTGNNFVHIDNVKSIADMNIDFTIANSHQFEIIVDSSVYEWDRFIFPVIWNKRTFDADMQNAVEQGLHSNYPPNKVRPYEPYDIDNPEFFIKHIGYTDMSALFREFYFRYADKFETTGWGGSIGKVKTIDWSKRMPTNYFYLDRDAIDPIMATMPSYWADAFDVRKCYKSGSVVRGLGDDVDDIFMVMADTSCGTCMQNNEFNEEGNTGTSGTEPFNIAIYDTKRVFDVIVGKYYSVGDIIKYNGFYYFVIEPFTMEDFGIDSIHTKKICNLLLRMTRRTVVRKQSWNAVFAELPITLYPKFMPIERHGETHNNRPVYEPWLIYPFGLVVSYWTPDEDDEWIPVFDLSPRWL